MNGDNPEFPVRNTLLAADEPAPWRIVGQDSLSPFFLICDHAGLKIPRRLSSLGLPDEELHRHIGWDIGAESVTLKLAGELGATAILQTYSRLVIDCNRPLHSPDSIAKISEHTSIPGNQFVSQADAVVRAQEIFLPYHAAIRKQLDARQQRGQPSLLIAMHSFTPIYLGVSRPWHIGMLYNRDARLAHALSAALRAESAWTVGDNEPYSLDDASDYSIPEHGERRGLAHVEVEIRQDLIADEAGQQQWANRLAGALHSLAGPLTNG